MKMYKEIFLENEMLIFRAFWGTDKYEMKSDVINFDIGL